MEKSLILVVDDVAQNITILKEALEADFQLAAAINGKRAIDYVKITQPDLVLLDILMPDMDGYEVCRRMKEIPHMEDVPIIFITSLNDTENIIKGFHEGAMDYISKPFDIDEVKSRVMVHLGLKQYRDKLKNLVAEKTRHLEETNIALKVLLRNIEEDKKKVEGTIIFNVQNLVIPYLQEINGKGPLTDIQKKNISIAMKNLDNITATLMPKEVLDAVPLSPREIKVANLIKQGKTSKEIADVFRLTTRTIESYRNNIRKKLGIDNQKVNLQSFLASFEMK